jgi:preprotein translocase subunit YajC
MIYLFLSQFLFSFGLAIAVAYVYFLALNIEKKQEKEYQHLLKNIKHSGNLLEKIIEKNNEK